MAAAGVATAAVLDSAQPLRTARARSHPATKPAATPTTAPTPISPSAWMTGPWPLLDSPARMATANETSGATMPSLSPLSTLRVRRIRLGTNRLVTMPAPSPASVGARHAAARTANHTPSPPKTRRTASAPRTTVKGSPIPSKRAGTPTSWRSDVNRRRAESEKRIRTKVISAVIRMVVADNEMWKVWSAPKVRPPSVNTIGEVMPIRSAGPETTVHSTTRVPTTARSAHVTACHPNNSK